MRKLGKYEVLGELGHGAMGVVYRARDPVINRLVALKTITTGLADDPNLLQRFYREAQSAGGLQHPNIVTIYDMGDEQDLPYIAMELIEGESLEQIIAQRTNLPVVLKLTYALQACRAFDYAHKRGLIHRDIKPGNVMVNKEGVVKVVDFGIARVLDTSKTQTGMLIGTFAYMSPEQYHGEHADERSDIWSFGVLLYELLCYQRPFTGENPASLMHSICQQEPRPLHELTPDCPPQMEVIISKVLRKSPQDRCQSMEDLLLELDPLYRELQSRSIVELINRSRQLIEEGGFAQARELLRESLKVDSANTQARALLEKVNAELKRILIRPRAQQHVEKGRTLIEEGRIQEARTEVESALRLDSSFEPAQELQKQVQHELDRAQVVAEWLHSTRQRLAEGMPDEAEALLAKVLEVDPSNKHANVLQQQVQTEKAERQRRLRLLEQMQEARGLWTQQNYEASIEVLTALQKEFPSEDEIQRLLETVREDQAEQYRQNTLERVRNLLAGGGYAECTPLLLELQKQFPNDDETFRLLEEVRLDEAKQRRLQGLEEARSCLASGHYQESIALLVSLEKEFPEDQNIPRLLRSAGEGQAEQQRQQGIAEVRNLLASRRYEDCDALLGKLGKQFPNDGEIPELLNALREDQAEQRKLKSLMEARNLLAARQYEQSIALLTELGKEFSGEQEIPRLLTTAREGQAEQQRQQGIAEVRNLLASRRYEDCDALLGKLGKQFPNDGEIPELLNALREDQAEQRKLKSLTEARNLLAARQYEQSIALLTELGKEFSGEQEIPRLLTTAREGQAEQQRQQGIAEVRNLLASRRYEDCDALLGKLGKQFPNDGEIPELLNALREDQAEQRKLKSLMEARNLLAARQYEQSIALLTELGKEFPGEQEIPRLLTTAREGQAEQQRQQGIAEVRNLLASRRYEDCDALLGKLGKQFPNDGEIPELLNALREDQAEQRKLKSLTEARNLLAARQYEQSIALLTELGKEFSGEQEIPRLLTTAREGQAEQQRQQGIAEVRNLLASRRYEDCDALLGKLGKQFPNDGEIPELLNALREDQAEQRKLKSLTEARNLLAARQYEQSIALLTELGKEFPGEQEIPRLLTTAREGQAEQQRQQGIAEVRNLLASRRYEDCDALLGKLGKQFPNDGEIPELLNALREDQAEQRKLKSLMEARNLLAARQYEQSIALLTELGKEFPGEQEIPRLLTTAREGQAEQRKLKSLTEARNLLGSRRYEESISLLTVLRREFPNEPEIPRLLTNAGKEQAEQQKQQKMTEGRALLAAQRFNEALELLDTLRATHPKDTAIQKLHALIEREREKQTRGERLQLELEGLKKLVSQKKYSDILSRAETLRAEFPGNVDLLRLFDFARSQQSQIESETRLRAAIDEVKTHSRANRFAEAINAANAGLKAFPDNAELLYLHEQTESQQKKQLTRGLIEQRIREIKFKINREDFTEAIDLARKTIAVTGSDADLTQLLNSAVIELQTREKKRKREQKLQQIRTMMESGNVDQAAETLYDAVATEALDGFDPRVSRISQEIDVAKNTPHALSPPAAPSSPVNFSKEYAFLQGAPAEIEPPPHEKVEPAETSISQASTSQISSQPVVPMPPQFEPIPPAAAPPTALPSEASQPAIAFLRRDHPQPLAPPLSPESVQIAPEPTVPAVIPLQPAPATTLEGTEQISPQTGDLHHPGDFKKPVAIGALALGLILAVWAGMHFIPSSKTDVSPAVKKPNAQTTTSPKQPSLSPGDVQQRSAIEASERLIASGDLKGALQALQDAEKLNGPLTAEIKSKEATVNESMRNESLAKLRQQEATLWQQATNEVQKSEFDAAKRDLRKIISYGDGGVRRADAQNILDNVIPRRQQEEEVFRQATRSAQANDLQGLQRAADLFGQVLTLNGPRKIEAAELQRNVEAKLSSLKLEDANRQIAALESSARKNIQQGDFNGARQKVDQIRQAGGDSMTLSREIDQAQLAQTRLAQQQREFQQAVQAYNALGSRDRAGLEKSGNDFQTIVRENGPQAVDAQKYLTEINGKLEALIEAPPPPPRTAKTDADTTATDDGAIRDVTQKFFHAFEQRNPDLLNQVWPSIPEKRYDGYKRSFEQASAIGMQVVNESVKISPDGATASVSAQTQQQYTPKGQKSMRSAQSWSFQLAKVNGVWVITGVQ